MWDFVFCLVVFSLYVLAHWSFESEPEAILWRAPCQLGTRQHPALPLRHTLLDVRLCFELAFATRQLDFFYLFLFKWKIITCWIWKQYHFRCVCLSLSYRSLIRPCFWTCKVVNSTIPTGCSLPWRCHGATASETLQMSRYGMTLHQSLFWSLIFSLLFAALQELIPELFYLPELLVNANQYQMGQTEDNVTVSDVILPRWASSPEEFIRIHRMVR